MCHSRCWFSHCSLLNRKADRGPTCSNFIFLLSYAGTHWEQEQSCKQLGVLLAHVFLKVLSGQGPSHYACISLHYTDQAPPFIKPCFSPCLWQAAWQYSLGRPYHHWLICNLTAQLSVPLQVVFYFNKTVGMRQLLCTSIAEAWSLPNLIH